MSTEFNRLNAEINRLQNRLIFNQKAVEHQVAQAFVAGFMMGLDRVPSRSTETDYERGQLHYKHWKQTQEANAIQASLDAGREP